MNAMGHTFCHSEIPTLARWGWPVVGACASNRSELPTRTDGFYVEAVVPGNPHGLLLYVPKPRALRAVATLGTNERRKANRDGQSNRLPVS